MCQLTLANLRSKKLNSLHTYLQLIENSRYTHKDGCGFYSTGGEYFKTKLCPNVITNLGKITDERILLKTPVISHVRMASVGKSYVPKDEDSHPFIQNNLVLTHNGTLDFKEKEREKDPRFVGKIDSEIFSLLLDESYVKTGNMVESLKEVYNLFWGKFAFMIYSKPEKKFYIARGYEATLYSCVVRLPDESFGMVINTNMDDLKKVCLVAKNLAELFHKVSIEYYEPELLKSDSIFVLNEEMNILEKVGDLREIKKPVEKYSYYEGYYDQEKKIWVYGAQKPANETKPVETKPVENKNQIIPIEKNVKKSYTELISNFMWEYDLKLEDIDELLFWTLGTPLLYCTSGDINNFVEIFIPLLEEEAMKQKNIVKSWIHLLNLAPQENSESIIIKHKLQFPYFLNNIEKIRAVKKYYKIEDKDDKEDKNGVHLF